MFSNIFFLNQSKINSKIQNKVNNNIKDSGLNGINLIKKKVSIEIKKKELMQKSKYLKVLIIRIIHCLNFF